MNVVYSQLNSLQRAELRIFAMKEDLPEQGGIRFYLDEQDMNLNIQTLLKNGMSEEEIVRQLSCQAYSKTRLKTLVKSALQHNLQVGLNAVAREAQDYMQKTGGKTPDLRRLCEAKGIDPKYAGQLLVTKQTTPQRGRITYRSMNAKQKALRGAGDSLAKYLENILEWTRNGYVTKGKSTYQMTKEVAIKLVNSHIATAEDILRSAQEGLKRVEQI